MSVYHQMGFNSNNLVDLPEMSSYAGAIFSPINANQGSMVPQVEAVRVSRGPDFEVVFDPQLYVPATERGKLKEWSYFPKDVDTADISSHKWWAGVNSKLAQAAGAINAAAACSPIVIPKLFDDSFYSNSVEIAKDLASRLASRSIGTLQTALVNLPALSSEERSYQVASIISKTPCNRVYLVFVSDVEPRRELTAPDELLGAMRIVNLLENSGLRVLVGFCSSDFVLWKAAGATACASGKFFNLRRFTRQRFEEPSAAGGGQLPYWYEEGLMAFLREPDLLQVRKHGFLSEVSLHNPFGQQILTALDDAKKTGKKKPWLGTSWRHFLYWFADSEHRLAEGEVTVEQLLTEADGNWLKLDKAKVLMVERANDGSWVRSWLNVLNAFTAA